MSQTLAQLRQLTWHERRLLVAASGWLILVRSLLARRSFKQTLAQLERFASKQDVDDRDAATIVRLVQVAASRNPWPAECVPQAITSWLLLRRHGYAPTVVLGADRDAGLSDGLAAHAWVEIEGEPVGENDDIYDKFVAFR